MLLPAEPHPDRLLHLDAGAGPVQNLVLHCKRQKERKKRSSSPCKPNLEKSGHARKELACSACCAATLEIKCVHGCLFKCHRGGEAVGLNTGITADFQTVSPGSQS